MLDAQTRLSYEVPTARVKLSAPAQQAWRASLIEEDEEAVKPLPDGSIELAVGPWEIVTLKIAL